MFDYGFGPTGPIGGFGGPGLGYGGPGFGPGYGPGAPPAPGYGSPQVPVFGQQQGQPGQQQQQAQVPSLKSCFACIATSHCRVSSSSRLQQQLNNLLNLHKRSDSTGKGERIYAEMLCLVIH